MTFGEVERSARGPREPAIDTSDWRKAAPEHLPKRLKPADAALLSIVGLPTMWFMNPDRLDQVSASVATIQDRQLLRLGSDEVTAIWLDLDSGEVLARPDDRIDPDRTEPLSVLNSSLGAFQRACAAWQRAAHERQRSNNETAVRPRSPLLDHCATS